MAFPQTPLPVTFYVAPGANPNDPSTYQFTDITTDVRYASGIRIQAGRQDEGSQVNTTSHQVTLDNSSGNYSRRNPLGAWYGQLRSGTPIQTRVKLIDDQFDRVVASGLGTDADTGQTWTADSVWSVDGANAHCTLGVNIATRSFLTGVASDDVDIVKVTSLNQVTTGAAWVDATLVRYSDAFNYYRIHTEYGNGGVISVKMTKIANSSPTDIYTITPTSVSYSAGTKIRTRVQCIGPTFRIKVWLDGGAEPAAWTASATDSSTTAPTAAVGMYQWRVFGNTNTDPLTVTVYSYRCDAIRATTPVPEWSPRWNQTGTVATAPIVGAGILRRLSQGEAAFRSPLYRGLLAQAPAGFWPLEDGSGATQASSALPGVSPARVSNVTFGNTGPAGAESVVTTNASASTISGTTFGPDTANGYACMILVKFGSLPGSQAPIVQWTATGTVVTWTISGDASNISITGTDQSGATVVTAGPNSYGVDPTKWWVIQLVTSVSGGTVSWSMYWTELDTGVGFVLSGTYSGSAPRPTGFKCYGMANVSYSMSWLGSNAVSFGGLTFETSLIAMASGWAGETAGNRMVRLAAEESVPLIVMGDLTKTAPMGVQGLDTFLNLLRECEEADQGLLHERGAGLGYLAFPFRVNPPVALALDFAQGHIAATPEPTDDDLHTANVVKLKRKNGSEVIVETATSVALSGPYTDERTVNLFLDSQLSDQAGWRLHLGTIDELRWPRVTLSLHANPSLIPAWCGLRIGSRITVANPPAAVAGGSLDLIIEGYTETISLFTWDVEINCSPAKAWDTGVYDDGTTRYDLASSTMSTTAAAGVTSLVLQQTQNETWSTTSTPYGLLIAGELVTVTAMGARSGTGPWTQTATVTRAVNGIAKTLTAGAEVHIATPGRWGL